MPDVYGVFEGGGVRGTALVGAVAAAEERNISFRAVAGTSAGAIVASLVAAGYNASEMNTLLMGKDLREFKDPVAWPGFRWLSSFRKMGFYRGESFRRWINEQIARKLGKPSPRFADLPKPLTIVATDVTLQEAKVFNKRRTHDLLVADAVRMSMGIPFFYVPFPYGSSMVVDGGVLSNFPAWAFQEEQKEAPLPILGFRLKPDAPQQEIRSIVDLVQALASTVVKAAVSIQLQVAGIPDLNVIELPTLGVQTTDFDMSQAQKASLYEAGHDRTLAWLLTHGF
jgi:NTE family protein